MDSITTLYRYQIRTDHRTDEDGIAIAVYGIEVYQDTSTEPMTVLKDLFTRRSQVEELADLCNRLELDPVHLTDVVEDMLVAF